MLSLLLSIAALLIALGGGPAAFALDGGPDEHCTGAPDYPLGWDFNEACLGHDECIDALGRPSPVPERLDCDDEFLAAMLDAPRVADEMRCHESALCGFIAHVYYHVVRLVTLMGDGASEVAHPGAPRTVP
jgi:hypothetical protein